MAREIDAAGKLVLPGGIDSHCHIEQVTAAGILNADDFFSGTVSAAFGGNTTVIPFAAQERGQSLRQAVMDYHACAEPKAVLDYAFHLIVTDPNERVLGQELPALIRDGYTSLKIFVTYERLKIDDFQVLDVLDLARREGALVMVHAENDDAIRWLGKRLLEKGHHEPRFFTVAHTRIGEGEATHRVIALSRLVDVPLLIVHVSSAEATGQIRWAQDQGLKVYGETCPQYLFLTAEDSNLPGTEGAKYCCSPAAPRCGRPGGDLARDRQRHVPGRFFGPRALPLRRDRQARPRTPCDIRTDRGRRSRHRGAPSASLFRRRPQGPHGHQSVRRPGVHQRREDLWALSAKRHHRGRVRCRHRHLGSGAASDHRCRHAP